MNKEKYPKGDCKHKDWERIGMLLDNIYSETQEKCKLCGLVRKIGEGDWKDRDAYSGRREEE